MFGLGHLVTKGASDTLTTLKEILNDMNDASISSTSDAGKKSLLILYLQCQIVLPLK